MGRAFIPNLTHSLLSSAGFVLSLTACRELCDLISNGSVFANYRRSFQRCFQHSRMPGLRSSCGLSKFVVCGIYENLPPMALFFAVPCTPSCITSRTMRLHIAQQHFFEMARQPPVWDSSGRTEGKNGLLSKGGGWGLLLGVTDRPKAPAGRASKKAVPEKFHTQAESTRFVESLEKPTEY